MHRRRTSAVLAAALCTLALSACIVVRDSAAPGCRKVIGLPAMGGCSGKAAIVDLAVEPQVECLTVTANNCNGGVLAVANACAKPLSLGGAEIGPQERETLDVVERDGQYALAPARGNVAVYLPQQDEPVEITGHLSEMELRVTFTKTGPLCD